MTSKGTALLTVCVVTILTLSFFIQRNFSQGGVEPFDSGERRDSPSSPFSHRRSTELRSPVSVLEFEPAEKPLPEISPPTAEAHLAWDALLLVAGQAGIRLELDQPLSFSEWGWLSERVSSHLAAVDIIDELRFPRIEAVMDRKALVGDVDIITADTPPAEAHRLMLPTRPGQVVTAIGEGGITKLVRVNLSDDYGLEAAHQRISELERIMLLEVMTRSGYQSRQPTAIARRAFDYPR